MMKIQRVLAIDLFETEEFRRNPHVIRLCRKIGYVWVTWDRSMPTGHFSTFFGVIVVRDFYKNKYIQDLYYLHELTHVATLVYKPDYSYVGWVKNVTFSELDAALASECYSYRMVPGLRQKTFGHEIWMDRYLGSSYSRMPLARLKKIVRRARLKALSIRTPMDFPAYQIFGYGQSNERWCFIWSEKVGYGKYAEQRAFRVVNEHMAALRSIADPDQATMAHAAWLAEVTPSAEEAAALGVAQIPFALQAREFDRYYKENLPQYANSLYSV